MFTEKNKFSILVALLLVSALVSAVSAIIHARTSGQLRGLQSQAVGIENNRNLTRTLAAETIEYSKRNPAIDPVLQKFGIKPAPSSPKAAK